MKKNALSLSSATWTVAVLFAALGGAFSVSMLVHADMAATINSTVMNGSNATTTSAQIGTLVHDSAMIVDPTGSTTPTGTVDFNLYPSTDCSGTASTEAGVALVSGMATSNATSVPNTGLSYKVHYNGQSGVFSAGDGQCEPVSAIKYAPTVSTDILNESNVVVTSATASSTVHDRATITGAGPTPTGTVDFTFYNNNSCSSGSAAGTGMALSGNVATSSAEGPLTPGSYSFKAHYNGDANYAATDSQCETLSIGISSASITTALSSTSVVVGSSVYDTAHLNGTTAGAGGSVQYTIFTDSGCSSAMQGAGNVTVSGSSVPNSNSVVFNNTGTYYWQASYSGDQNNAAATSSCSSEILTVLATSTPPTSTSTGMIAGQVYNDANDNHTKDGGDSGLSGWTVHLSGFHRFLGIFNTWWWHWGGTQSATTDSNGNYSFSNLKDGTYFVTEVTEKGWTPTTNPIQYITIQNGVVTGSADFGNFQTSSSGGSGGSGGTGGNGSLSGAIYNDQNSNNVKDSGDTGLSGFTVNLYAGANFKGRNQGNILMHTVTDSNGNYSFTGLADGTYSIEEINQANWHQTTSDYKSVTISGGESKTGLDIANIASTQSNNGKGDNDNDNDDKGGDKSNNGNHNGQTKVKGGFHISLPFFGKGKDN